MQVKPNCLPVLMSRWKMVPVIHIVPRLAGAKSGGVFQAVLGAAVMAVAIWMPGVGIMASNLLFSLGASMTLGGVAQMLAPKPKTPRTQTTDNGKQNTYFSSLDNMVAQGNVLPVLYGEMRVGSRVVSQEISTADRRGWWSGCGDWSLMQNVLCETASGRFYRLWSMTNG
ncbi:putative phage tail component [Escherichia coli]|uniref:Putative phage tail component n=1 Tax=Escherichia coli TaxID=562 RepID=A0A376LPH2_ECOLX|nr:putative phage tail component [Escherichia coli]